MFKEKKSSPKWCGFRLELILKVFSQKYGVRLIRVNKER